MNIITLISTSARRSLAAAVLLFAGLLSVFAGGATSTYYYRADVSVTPNGSGKVYVSNQSTSDPNYQNSSNTGTLPTYVQNVTLYLYAQANENYIFSKWQRSNNGNNGWYDITVTNNNVQITATSENQGSPTRYYYRAVFEEQTGVVKVAVAEEGRGSVSINPANNRVGRQVTLTATPDASNGVHFLGWNKDRNDTENFISTQTPYTFTITNDNQGTYYAHFSEAQEIIYCRIQNKTTKRFLTLYGNKKADKHIRTVNSNSYDDGFKFDYSLQLIEESSAKGNPMTVFLRSGHPAGAGSTNGVNLVANNIGYNDLLNEDAATNHYPLTMVTTNNGVQIFTSYTTRTDDGDMTYNTYLTDEEGGNYAVMQSDNTKNIYWDVFLLEEENTSGSFGANAKADFSGNGTYGENGKYYTTMYTYFPYKLLDGVKAYYLPLAEESYTEATKTVHFTEITSGIIPMNTAVVLECPADYRGTNNRLQPLMVSENPGPLSNGNLLNGYISLSDNGNEPNKEENKTSRFILSKINGRLGWYYFTEDYMTPNKAFLDLSPWEEYYQQHQNEARSIKFQFGFDDDHSGEATGVIAPEYAEKVDGPLFDLNGRRVTDGSDAYGLKKGIYIRNGKKIVVK